MIRLRTEVRLPAYEFSNELAAASCQAPVHERLRPLTKATLGKVSVEQDLYDARETEASNPGSETLAFGWRQGRIEADHVMKHEQTVNTGEQ
jgi:hypothetical protein